ncbi:MAG TPA: ABC transporter permease subunit [Actinomycetota bacterium]|jgi:ABC-2 type transport system permease protein|nr:ABC transporter permease subunit [Actinomycetota bacterium]
MTVLTRFLRDRRRSLGWWSLGVIGFVFMQLAFYPSFKNQPQFDDLFNDLPEGVKALIGASGLSLREPAGYLHSQVFTTLLPIILLIFAIALGARAIGGSEDDGTIELLLANPVSRVRTAVERAAATAALVSALGAIATIGLIAVAAPFQLLEGVSVAKLVAACLAATSLALLHASIAYFVGAAFGGRVRAISVAATVAVAGYVLFGLVSSGVMRGARFASPWYWYLDRNIVAKGPGAEAIFLPLGLAVAFAAAGVWRFVPRDLR